MLQSFGTYYSYRIMQGSALKAAKEENCAKKQVECANAYFYAPEKPEEIYAEMDDF